MSEQKVDSKEASRLTGMSPRLSYVIPAERRVVVQRRTLSWNSPTVSYTAGETIDMTFGSQFEYMYGPNSYLKFRVTSDSTELRNVTDSTKYGSYTNLFSAIRITSKGVLIEDIRGLDSLRHVVDHYSCNNSYLSHTGQLLGYEAGNKAQTGDYVVIPLHHISTLLGQNKYFPLPEFNDVRLELVLNPHNVAFSTAGATPTTTSSYTITDFKIVGDMYRVSDTILRAGRALSKAGKMVWGFDTYHYNRSSLAAGSNTIELKKSIGKAMSVFSRIKATPANANERYQNLSQGASITDNAGATTSAWEQGVSRFQVLHGSEYHPVTPITDAKFAMAEAMKCFGNLSHCGRPPAVNFTNYQTYNNILAVDLERDLDDMSGMQGVSTKDSARLLIEITPPTALANPFIESWIHHLKLLLVHSDSIAVKE